MLNSYVIPKGMWIGNVEVLHNLLRLMSFFLSEWDHKEEIVNMSREHFHLKFICDSLISYTDINKKKTNLR